MGLHFHFHSCSWYQENGSFSKFIPHCVGIIEVYESLIYIQLTFNQRIQPQRIRINPLRAGVAGKQGKQI